MATINGVPFASVNSSSYVFPYNVNGSFVDSTIGYNGQRNLETSSFYVDNPVLGTKTILANGYNNIYTLGNKYDMFTYASTGLYVDATQGIFGLNVNDNPNQPEFRRDKAMQYFGMYDSYTSASIAIAGGNVSLFSNYGITIEGSNLNLYSRNMFSNDSVVIDPNGKCLKITADDFSEYYIPLYTL